MSDSKKETDIEKSLKELEVEYVNYNNQVIAARLHVSELESHLLKCVQKMMPMQKSISK